jgi:hypothetical protein
MRGLLVFWKWLVFGGEASTRRVKVHHSKSEMIISAIQPTPPITIFISKTNSVVIMATDLEMWHKVEFLSCTKGASYLGICNI